MNYSINELIKIFETHVADYEKNLALWNEQNPTTRRSLEEFILPRALFAIVKEIKQLKDKYETSQPAIPSDMSIQESKDS